MDIKTIVFDMDGTVADLYSAPDWLDKLRAYDPSPYAEAAPMGDLGKVAMLCEMAQAMGIEVTVISWLSKESTKEYDRAVRAAKRAWLKAHLPIDFDHIHLVRYGTPKHRLVKDKRALLFDDNGEIREAWAKGTRGQGLAVDPVDGAILQTLLEIIGE